MKLEENTAARLPVIRKGDRSEAACIERAQQTQSRNARLAGSAEETRALEDGLALRIRRTAETEAFLTDVRADIEWRLPSVVTSTTEDGEHVWLHIRGPRKTREFIEYQFRLATFEPPPRLREAFNRQWRRVSRPIRRLPDYLIIGTVRGGSSALYSYLRQHPRILPAVRKELRFFDRQEEFSRGEAHYRMSFSTRLRNPRAITGEASPTYLLDPDVPERVRAMVPNVKLIMSLRNPVDRAYSHYCRFRAGGYEPLPFEEALDREQQGRTDYPLLRYREFGEYADQVERWLGFFPREQMLVLGFEEMTRDLRPTLDRIMTFLNLPAFDPARKSAIHGVPYVELDPTVRQRLVDYYRPHNERLFDLLGRDFGWND